MQSFISKTKRDYFSSNRFYANSINILFLLNNYDKKLQQHQRLIHPKSHHITLRLVKILNLSTASILQN